jgi:citrate lyase subunit beta / citryl-CoA lyase
MRSLLFVPADSEKKLPKALAAGADVVILDLEDSVALADKAKARGHAREVLTSPRRNAKLFVRVNALGSGFIADDMAAIVEAKPDGLLLPKSESGADVKRLIAMAGLPVIAIATETAAAMFNLGTYGDCGPHLLGLTWGMEDLAAALGAQSNRDAEGRPTAPYHLAGLETQCRDAVRDGFTAKLCIHPDQVEVINRIFTPSPEAIARAQRIVKAFAEADNAGVIGLDGEMLDVPHLKAAQALLARVG